MPLPTRVKHRGTAPAKSGAERGKALAFLDDPERRALPTQLKVRDSLGRYLSTSLFWEKVASTSRYAPLYTLDESDKHLLDGSILPSARRIYLEIADPTEYEAAMALLGSWEHWTYLCGLSWFKPYIESWRFELQEKLKSRAVEIAKKLALGSDATALSASKWLHAQMSPKNRGGRPRNPDKKPSLPDTSETDKDYARITDILSNDEE